MIYLILFLIWILGIVVMELQLSYQKKYKRYEYNQRQHGMISFNNNQLAIMRWLWPITVIVFMVLLTIVLLIKFVIDVTVSIVKYKKDDK